MIDGTIVDEAVVISKLSDEILASREGRPPESGEVENPKPEEENSDENPLVRGLKS